MAATSGTKSMIHTLGDLLKYETNQNFTRKVLTLKSQVAPFLPGTVLGMTANDVTPADTVVTAGTNTGNGTLTKDATAPVKAGAMVGIYKVVVSEAAVATTPAVPAVLTISDPQGDVIGTAAAGTTYDGAALKFATTVGGTPYAVGDSWTIEVVAGSGKCVPVALADAADGSHIAIGVLLGDFSGHVEIDASAADQKGVVLVRGPALVAKNRLIFGASFDTAGKKAPKLAQLEALGIGIALDA